MQSRLNMRNTTLCYLERDDRYLMLHRIKKQEDLNRDKWIGIGGKFEEGESPEDCLLREVREETGLTLDSWRYCGSHLSQMNGERNTCIFFTRRCFTAP